MKAISLPFRLDSFGNVATSTDLPKIWGDKVKTVVSTALGERLMRSDFGCSLPNNLFEIAVDAPGFADGQIQAAFTAWLPEVDFVRTDLEETELGTVSLNVVYRIPKFDQTNSTTYTVSI